MTVAPRLLLLVTVVAVFRSTGRAVAMGMDAAIGLLHVDTPNRDSLACDLMEVCRPRGVDAFVLNWLQRAPSTLRLLGRSQWTNQEPLAQACWCGVQE